MKVQVLQHVPFEDLGCISQWLARQAAACAYTRFHAGDLPDPRSLPDLAIVLGGPMSVNDEQEYPWLKAEKAYVRTLIEARIPVLGICLGAQLIASAMGARVYPAREPEIGWFPVAGVAEPGASAFVFPRSLQVFHWHGETFDLPARATRLASSPVCPNQAFALGSRCVGVQFHLETTPDSMRSMLQHCASDLSRAGAYVQSAETMQRVDAAVYDEVNAVMSRLLDVLLSDAHSAGS